jgi:hypothetical protein
MVTALLFFAVGERFGKINDALSVAQMVLMLPVVVALLLLHPTGATGLALLAAVVGIVGMVVTAVLQGLLVIEVVKFEQTITTVLAAGGAVGLWLILTNVLALFGEILPTSLVVFGIVGGVGYVLAAVGFYSRGQQHPLFYIGGLLMVVGYSVWAAWLGRLLLAGNLAL